MDKNVVGPNKIMEVKGPDKDIIAMTTQILTQHDQILRMNAELLKVMNNPICVVSTDRGDE